MAVQVATRKKPKAKASSRSGAGSFGYPWGTERPNAVYERLGMAQFAQAEDEIRQVEAEAARRVRQIRMRMDVLDQIKRGVQKCCTVMADGKLRFSRELADAAGPLFDVSMAREVVDLDKRRPGRPSATANLETQALRAVMRELVHDPAAEYRRRQIEGSVAPGAAGGGECKTRRRPVAIVPLGEVATRVSPLAPTGDIVVPPSAETEVEAALSERVGDIPHEAEAGVEDVAGAHPAVEAEAEAEVEVEPVEPEIPEEPPPETDPEVLRAAASVLAETDTLAFRSEWSEAVDDLSERDATLRHRMSGATLTYFPSHSPDRIAQREKRLDLELLPEDLRQQILPELTPDPQKVIPALEDVIWGMGLPWHKDPSEVSEAELRGMFDVGASYEVGSRLVRSDQEWDRMVRMAGGVHRVTGLFGLLLQDPQAAEALRREVWPLVVARRDILEGLRRDVASGKITYSPLSDHVDDRENSLEYTLFKSADYEMLNSLNENYWKMYVSIVDNLEWPKGLSRRELCEKFGAGQSPDDIPNLCVYDEGYVEWLVPPHFRAIETAGIVAHVNEEPYDFGELPPVVREPDVSAFRREIAALGGEPLHDV